MADETKTTSMLQQMQEDIEHVSNPNKVSGQIAERYRRTFDNAFGRIVLGQMLLDYGLLAELDGSAEQTARHNAAVQLLRSIGVIQLDAAGHIDAFCMGRIVDVLMSLAIPQDEQTKEN